MRDKMLAIVAPYFGKLPKHFQFWLDSCSRNPQITWLLFTDDKTPWNYPSNVRVTYCTLDDLRERFQQQLGFKIALSTTQKLGDYKPLYGFLFQDELAGYKEWGHIDVGDVIYGSFDRFAITKRAQEFDRMGCVGHLTIYRNTPEINRRFMASSRSGIGYREIFSTPVFKNFEEMAPASIGQIWSDNGWVTGSLDDCVADISSKAYPFRISMEFAAGGIQGNNHHLIFEWNNGRLLGHEIAPFGGVLTREFLYVHFKRRPMKMFPGIDPNHYLIAPDGFHPCTGDINVELLKKLTKAPFPDPVFMTNKWRNLKARFKH